jgi:hypothetical protein
MWRYRNLCWPQVSCINATAYKIQMCIGTCLRVPYLWLKMEHSLCFVCRPGSKDHWDLDAQVYAEWGEQQEIIFDSFVLFVIISPTK